MADIKHNDVFHAQLKEWNGALKEVNKVDTIKDMWINNTKNELYQLISFYIIFQGVVFTIVVQVNTLNCNSCYFPTFLSLLASLVIGVGVYQKLYGFNNLKFVLQDVIENVMVKISIFGQNDFQIYEKFGFLGKVGRKCEKKDEKKPKTNLDMFLLAKSMAK